MKTKRFNLLSRIKASLMSCAIFGLAFLSSLTTFSQESGGLPKLSPGLSLPGLSLPMAVRSNPSKDSFPQVSSIYLELNTTHYYKSPMIGIMFERGFVEEKRDLTFIAKVGAWVYPIKKENNFFVVQVGGFKTLKNKRTDIGFYLIDFNGHAFPRPSYDTPWDTMQKYPNQRPKDEYGYNSPFSAFVTVRPFGSTKQAQKFEVTTKVSYFTNSNIVGTRFGVMVSLRYKLYGNTKRIAPTPYEHTW